MIELVLSLARRATAGEVLTTDVVTQLVGGDERTFANRGHMRTDGRPTRVHALVHGTTARGRPTFGRELELASIDWLIEELLSGSGRAVVLDP